MTSCIDHIMTNCPDKMTNVTTHYDNSKDYDCNNDYYDYEDYDYIETKVNRTNITISDHAIISCNYNSKFFKTPQLFKIIRDNNKLQGEKLRGLFNMNKFLPPILYSNDVNYIAETLVNELSIIVETLAPAN